MKNELSKLREEIDAIDDQIVGLLSKRMDLVKAVGKLKKEHNIEPLDVKRLEEVLHSKKERAKLLGVSQKFIEKLYTVIHDYSVKAQKKLR